jgi:multimeric flavodoxin WrbA
MIEVKYGSEMSDINKFLAELSGHKKVTFVTTSSRSEYIEKMGESPKSSQLARSIAESLKRRGVEVEVIDGAKLNIHNCLGCVSEQHGNHCGAIEAKLKDDDKNPNGLLRCWASHDYKDDELWKISKSIYESQAVIFFGSQRWGSVNATYQKIIERLDWMENMHTTLGEPNSIKKIQAGLVVIGQNWRVKESLELQKSVLEFFGFDIKEDLFIGWQYTRDKFDENNNSYLNAKETFETSWGIQLYHWDKKESEKLGSENKISESRKNIDSFDLFLERIKSL